MKTSLSHVLFTLQAKLEGQPGPRWESGAQVIELEDAELKAPVWWIRQDSVGTLITEEQLDELVAAGLLCNNGIAQKKRFGRASTWVYGILVGALRKGVRAQESKASKLVVTGQRVKELESQLKASREHSAAQEAFAGLMEQMAKSFKIKPSMPKFVFDRDVNSSKMKNGGVATLLCSDVHWGEVVSGDQIEQFNEYNLDIASARMDRVFKTTLETLFHHQSGMSYEGFVLALGGDMVSGNILDELRETNEKCVAECVLSLAEKLSEKIIELADNFPGIFVPCVVGNHGRIDQKSKAKNAASDNFDYMLYRFVEMLVRGRMGNRCNVDFKIGTGLDVNYGVYRTGYLLTHGDSGQTGVESGGFLSAIAKTATRKKARALEAGGQAFDVMLCGHFHKYTTLSNAIVNGSLKGYDEWVYKQGFNWERPIQALWLTTPEHGITNQIAIYGDESIYDESHNVAPITPDGFRARNR